jgi:uncharacterized protein DUF4386
VEDRPAQLEWERRFALPAAGAALASLALGVAAQILSASTANRTGGQRAALLDLHEHADQALTATICQALSVLFLAGVLLYLLRCVRHRRQEGVQPAIGPLIMLAPILVTVGGVLSQLEVLDIADKFATTGARTEARADDLLGDRDTVPVFIGFAGNIAVGFGLVMVNLNAMRLGLMTRFIGIIGIVVGALYVLPIFAGPLIIQIFWLGSLVAIFLGFWPGGRGEAWETGEPGVWLSASEQRRQAVREARLGEEAPAETETETETETEPEPEPAPAEDLDARPHPVSKKRRRKRRK